MTLSSPGGRRAQVGQPYLRWHATLLAARSGWLAPVDPDAIEWDRYWFCQFCEDAERWEQQKLAKKRARARAKQSRRGVQRRVRR